MIEKQLYRGAAAGTVPTAAIAQNNRPPKPLYSAPSTHFIDLKYLRFQAKFVPMFNRWIEQKSGDSRWQTSQ
jgi:hypothetical protein